MITHSPHIHDVEILWNFWPFTYIIPGPIRRFLDGHGFNWIMNILNFFTFWPRIIWNSIGELIFPFNILWTFLMFVPNTVLSIPEILIFWLPDIFYYSTSFVVHFWDILALYWIVTIALIVFFTV